jgi:ubiquinone/menaquinone biosynthesis C-methylase UbiE
MRRGDGTYECSRCERTYPAADHIPVFVEEGAAQHDELDHLQSEHEHHAGTGAGHKAAQSAFYDRAELAEFEIERPVGAPSLYRFFLTEKFRRSIEPFNGRLDGWTALTVCGGSGMDAEFLASAGATVISSDLSLGAAHRVRERARRHRVSIAPIVADVERLPFADQSIDLVYVHDGLHHLEDPSAGIAEMVRVARRAVCINEPSRAAATRIGIRFGLALDREEAGNRVARLAAAETAAALEASGFKVVRADRYAMYYRHTPGRIMELLSMPVVLPLAVAWWRLANGIVGRFGNKLTVVAMRSTREVDVPSAPQAIL